MGATARALLRVGDGKSGASLERVTIGTETMVLKQLGVDLDWVARATGDLACRTVELWRAGALNRLPDCLDHAVIGAAGEPRRRRGALLMRDVARWLVPEGDAPLPLAQHRRFLTHMAALHATFWDFEDTFGLLPMSSRYTVLKPWTTEGERAYGGRTRCRGGCSRKGGGGCLLRRPERADSPWIWSGTRRR